MPEMVVNQGTLQSNIIYHMEDTCIVKTVVGSISVKSLDNCYK